MTGRSRPRPRSTLPRAIAVLLGLLAAAGCGGAPTVPRASAAERLNGEGVRRLDRGDLPGAEAVLREALEEGELVDDRAAQADAWNNLGALAMARGRPDDAVSCHRMAVSLQVARGARDAGAVRARTNLGAALLATGRVAEARAAFQGALDVSAGSTPPLPAPLARAGLSAIALRSGDARGAVTLAAGALADAPEDGDEGARAGALSAVAAAREALGDLAGARAALDEALALDRAREAPAAVAADLQAIAHVAERAGDPAAAAAHLARSARILRRLGDPGGAERALRRAVELGHAATPEDARRMSRELGELHDRDAAAAARVDHEDATGPR